jgi:hypothetical protein
MPEPHCGQVPLESMVVFQTGPELTAPCLKV